MMRRLATIVVPLAALLGASPSPSPALVRADEDVAAEMAKIANKAVDDARADAAKKAVAAKNAAIEIPEAQLKAMADQYLPQLRPAMLAELHFIGAACSPTKEQRAALAREGDRLLKEGTREYVRAQFQMSRGGGVSPPTDPRKLVAKGLAEVVKATFPAEAVARYQQEVDARAAALKECSLRNLVANLDEELLLDAGQRAKISETLAANWDEAWSWSPEAILYNNNQTFPNVPKLVVPVLSPAQKVAWEKMPKHSGQSWGNLNNFIGFTLEEDPPADMPADKPAEGDAGKADEVPSPN